MIRRILAAVLAVLLLTQTAVADVVALRDGRQIKGTVTNRDQVRQLRASIPSVWIQTAPADSSREYPRAEISTVVLEDTTGHRETIDFAARHPEKASMVPITPPVLDEQGRPGLGWMVGGVALFLAGAAVKMGEEETEPGVPPMAVERSYGTLNYVSMTVGAGLFFAGWGMLSRHRAGMQTGAIPGPAGPTVAVSIHF